MQNTTLSPFERLACSGLEFYRPSDCTSLWDLVSKNGLERMESSITKVLILSVCATVITLAITTVALAAIFSDVWSRNRGF